ncbi:hypothetical protein LIER_25236 [Lithospermum erythrorhizon]|uniref:DUF3615 domain-containing protein n=1 Tax=Lithospermum erythrorhizon TaxID=34254 RepID=A0AAV3R597_LITER
MYLLWLDSYAFADSSASWIHCCFNAKDDSSINNFFAELQYFYPSGPSVTTCKILIQGETQVGCGYCKSVTNPIVGYCGGFLGNINHASYAMSDDHEEDSPATTIGYPVTTNPFVPDFPTFNPGTKFGLVNDDSTYWSPFSGTWIHICFNAIDSSVVKLFFAEIKYDKFSEPAVTICKILEGKKGPHEP